MLVSKQNLSKNLCSVPLRKKNEEPHLYKVKFKSGNLLFGFPKHPTKCWYERPENSPEFGPAFVAEVVFCLVVSSLGQSLIRCPKPPQ